MGNGSAMDCGFRIYGALRACVSLTFILAFLANSANCAAAVWYVRPVAPNGTYGLENGTSYANAFNGLTAAGRVGEGIKWGVGGVRGGDTLYVCGNHWLKTSQS